MDFAAHISYRQEYSKRKVLIMRIIRYLQAGYLLHLMAIISIFMAFFFGKEFVLLQKSDAGLWKLLLFGYASTYFLTLILFSQFDARSRYQNYKMVKDKFFEYGFDPRLLKPFVFSRCQRDAIGVAARDMKFGKAWRKLTHQMGFRWYHLLPDLIVRSPRILFTKEYWRKTLLVKTYHSKYFLW